MIKGKEKTIKIELVDEPSSSVRININDREIYELSESIKEVGLIESVVVVEKGERFEIVAGHRRLLACREAGLPTIRCFVAKLNPTDMALVKATENLQKVGLTSVEEGGIYGELYDKEGLTINQIANKMGRSATHVKRMIDILRMDELVIKAIHEGKISIAVAEQLERIDDKKEKLRYLDIAVENGASSRVVKMWVEDLRKSLQYINNRDEIPPPDVDYIVPQKSYGACEMCDKAVEYKNIRMIKVCPECHRMIIDTLLKSRGE